MERSDFKLIKISMIGRSFNRILFKNACAKIERRGSMRVSQFAFMSTGRKRTEFSVDRSGLIGNPDAIPTQEENRQALFLAEQGFGSKDDEKAEDDDVDYIPPSNKEEMSELAKDLHAYISVKGPISIHDYMLQCSNHFVHGYYQTSASKIGSGGDFITAPEMSQLFGEMIGMWCISHWMSLGKPKTIDLIEMGPGKGTLMNDILNVAKKFPDFHNAIRVNFVELSDTMRNKQKKALGCIPTYDHNDQSLNTDANAKKDDVKTGIKKMISANGVPVTWYYSLAQVPETPNTPSLCIAQEFLDAFPIHQFEYRNGNWKERLVDKCNSNDKDKPYHFKNVLSPGSTPATKALLQGANISMNDNFNDSSHDSDGNSNSSSSSDNDNKQANRHQDGECLEVSPLALATCEAVAMKLCRTGGAGLFIDYGENYTQSDTLRGFKSHKQVNSLSEPGIVDITADVDFAACARAAVKRGAIALGAIPQGEFLVRMGIVERVQSLINSKNMTDENAIKILSSLRQLIDNRDMGKRFKVLALYDGKTNATATYNGNSNSNILNTIGFPPVTL